MKIFAANWKLQKSPRQARDFFSELLKNNESQKAKMIFFPSAISLEATSQALNATDIEFGAQNCFFEEKGAFTGENSAAVVKELGGQWVLIGHSERRTLFHETDQEISKKIKLSHQLGLKPMLCIGETLEQRQARQTREVLKRQMKLALDSQDKTKFFVMAYEPVWAIGTGVVATAEQVRETHAWINEDLLEFGFSQRPPLLYGGSVKAENAKELGQIPYVDGFLIGGASLEVKSYLDIVRAL